MFEWKGFTLPSLVGWSFGPWQTAKVLFYQVYFCCLKVFLPMIIWLVSWQRGYKVQIFGDALRVSKFTSYRGLMRLVWHQSWVYIGQPFSCFLPFFSIPVYIIREKRKQFCHNFCLMIAIVLVLQNWFFGGLGKAGPVDYQIVWVPCISCNYK